MATAVSCLLSRQFCAEGDFDTIQGPLRNWIVKVSHPGLSHSAFAHSSERKENKVRYRISMLLAVVLSTAGFAVLGPAQPASAWTACGGTGTATVSPGLYYPHAITTPSKTPGLVFDVLIGRGNPVSTLNFAPNLTGCAHGLNTTKTTGHGGTVKGYCGLASGRGTFTNGTTFAFIAVGPILILTGHMVAVVHATPDVFSGESCEHGSPALGPLNGGGALRFIIEGVFAKTNCDFALQTLVPGTPPDHESLLPVVTTQHLNALFHVLAEVGVHYYWNHMCVGSPVL